MTLLAKSPRGEQGLTLAQHLLDTEAAAAAIFQPNGRPLRSWLRFFRLGAEEGARFLLHLRLAALFHDIGKANGDFQAAVQGRGEKQMIRHEHLSALVLHRAEVWAWLGCNSDLDREVIVAAVLSHHLKVTDQDFAEPRRTGTVSVALDHSQVGATLRRIAEVASLPPPPPLGASALRSEALPPPWDGAYSATLDAAEEVRRWKEPGRKRLLLAVKAALISADAAASGLVREGHPITDWIEEALHGPALSSDDIDTHIVQGRLNEAGARTGRPALLHTFQVQAAEQGPRALLLAACGTGKTLAAWNWARAQAAVRPVGRVIFLYPTRGTATEGYKDYVSLGPAAEVALLHGSARYELESMQANPAEGDRALSGEPDERLYALGYWSRRYFSATVDQFLGFLEHSYSALCMLPALVDSVLIIDEVHSFDRRMFDHLCSFLHEFELPVLCMTATLPRSRRAELEAAGLQVFPRAEQRAQLEDLSRLEAHPRYSLARSTQEEALSAALDTWRIGRRVLWVVNTVDRCQEAARQLIAAGAEALVYHSRFTLSDRRDRHRAVVDAFRSTERPALAITTQVCEMSLDLDADLLITELAPIPSLVQRFGRANRHLARGLAFRGRLLVLEPPKALPYEADELRAARVFLERCIGADRSQADLALALTELARGERVADLRNPRGFLAGGYFATRGDFRDGDELTNPAVLSTQLLLALEAHRRREPLDGFIVPAPRGSAFLQGPAALPPYLRVVDGATYTSALGLCRPRAGAEA